MFVSLNYLVSDPSGVIDQDKPQIQHVFRANEIKFIFVL